MLSIGDVIRTNREAQNINQEALSFGICSTSNLSRIESGKQIPTRATYENLMGRLGLEPEIFPSFLNDQELEAFRLKHQINQAQIAGRYDEMGALVEKLEALPKLDLVNQRFVLYIRAILRRKRGAPPEEVLEAMKQVAALAVRNMDPKEILRQVLAKDELSILNNLAISYYNAGQEDHAIELLYALIEYIERKIVYDSDISPMYTAILFNLTNWVGLRGRYYEVIQYCDIGIKRCIEYGAYFSFPGLLFNKGYALVMLDRKDEARKYIQESYYIGRARGETKECEITENFAQEHGIEL